MMGNKEIEMITRINKDIQNLISDMNIIVADMGILSQLIYDSEISRCDCDNENEIKLRSHM